MAARRRPKILITNPTETLVRVYMTSPLVDLAATHIILSTIYKQRCAAEGVQTIEEVAAALADNGGRRRPRRRKTRDLTTVVPLAPTEDGTAVADEPTQRVRSTRRGLPRSKRRGSSAVVQPPSAGVPVMLPDPEPPF